VALLRLRSRLSVVLPSPAAARCHTRRIYLEAAELICDLLAKPSVKARC